MFTLHCFHRNIPLFANVQTSYNYEKSRSTEKLLRSDNIIFIENANSVTLLFVLYCSKKRNGVENMIYKCDNPYCGFLFERVGEVDCCPDCGHDDIRPANEEEQKEYLERKNKKR